ncbi:hypothetical protein ACFZCU_41300 [Streptomyces canus]|uniref:hypothetical protein n=1 Tax=Streptomyces canus TaxID=58343 RepID=UPI0036E32D0A
MLLRPAERGPRDPPRSASAPRRGTGHSLSRPGSDGGSGLSRAGTPAKPALAVTVEGTATGVLVGGILDAIRTEAGAGLPSLKVAILLLEHRRGTGLGEADRALTQLPRTGALDGLHGVALGQFIGFEQAANDPSLGGWGIAGLLHGRLTRLGVSVLGGLPAGHGPRPPTIPLGTSATIDTAAGTLTGQAAVV